MMKPSDLYQLLIAAETDGDRARDARRVLGAERQSLGLALERVQAAARAVKSAEAIRYSDEREIAVRSAKRDHSQAVHQMLTVATEAERVAAMWDVRASDIISPDDIKAIRELARQDLAGEVDDSYARTGDAEDTIRRWAAAGGSAGDRDLVQLIDRVGVREAARVYEAARRDAR